jgi:hypothetical protein
MNYFWAVPCCGAKRNRQNLHKLEVKQWPINGFYRAGEQQRVILALAHGANTQ